MSHGTVTQVLPKSINGLLNSLAMWHISKKIVSENLDFLYKNVFGASTLILKCPLSILQVVQTCNLPVGQGKALQRFKNELLTD